MIRKTTSILPILFAGLCCVAVATAQVPRGIPVREWRKRIPADNPITTEKVKLGEALYFDKRLSADGTVSCATCHDPASALTDRNATAVGVRSTRGARNAPTVLNAMFSSLLFWDGRAPSLEAQALQPLVSASEMGMQNYDAVVARVADDADYVQWFRRVFKSKVTIDVIAKAIAAFERTQLSGNSPFDRFIAGDRNAISAAQKRGWDLFRGKAKCIECHAFSQGSPFFSDFDFHNTGVAMKAADFGRYRVTNRRSDIGAFKTPTLRDVELTAPYMHDGSHKTLLDIVRFYDRGGAANPNLDKRIVPLNLTDAEMNALVEFMRSLTSDEVLRRTQATTPQTRVAVTLAPRR